MDKPIIVQGIQLQISHLSAKFYHFIYQVSLLHEYS